MGLRTVLGLLAEIFPSGKRLAANCISMFQIHLELCILQWLQEKRRMLDALFLLSLAWLFLMIGFLLLTALVLVLAWDDHRLFAMATLGSAYLMVGVCTALWARQKLGRKTVSLESSLRSVTDRSSSSSM